MDAILERYVIARAAVVAAARHPLNKKSRRAHLAKGWFKHIAKDRGHLLRQLIKAQERLDEAQARYEALARDPRGSEKKRQDAEKRWADAKANLDDLQARYNGQPTESDADRAFKRVLSIWQEEKRP